MIGNIRNLALSKLQAKHLLKLAHGFGLTDEAILHKVAGLEKYLPNALHAIEKSPIGSQALKTQLIEKMEKRWNGSFASIGQGLLKKLNKGVKPKS
jgi:hypothetical protein